MPCNEGKLDRILRIVVGLVLIALVFVGPHIQWGWLGLIPLASGIVGSPEALYMPMGNGGPPACHCWGRGAPG